MKIDVYKTENSLAKKGNSFVLVEAGSDTMKLPDQLLSVTGHLSKKKTIEIYRGKPRIGLDSDEVISNINKRGYHLEGVNIAIKIAPE